MNRKKLAIIISICVIGNYFIPMSYTMTSYAEQMKKQTNNTEEKVADKKNESLAASNLNLEVSNSKIQIINTWGGISRTIWFNPVNKEIFVKSNDGYLADTTENNFLNITISNPETGKIIFSKELSANNMQEQSLVKLLNSQKFDYGDIITLDYNASEGQIKVLNNEKNIGNSTGNRESFEITENGLIKNTLKEINVEPLEILNGTVQTSGSITGKSTPNSQVIIRVGNKEFKGTADEKGNFSIKVTDSNGITKDTLIEVWSKGIVPQVIYPTVNPHLGLFKSEIYIRGDDGVIAQSITFSPLTMKVSYSAPWGGQFPAELIDKDTGNIIGGCSTGNFNIATSGNNLNGATFKYGDIISIYEGEQTYLASGKPQLSQAGENASIEALKKFQSYEITPNGLVPVANKNFQVTDALFKGTQNITLTGKTFPNANVKTFYGKHIEKTTANSKGDFTINIPMSDTSIGSEIRVFVNNENNKNLILKYDAQTMQITNDGIQLVNNESFPVMKILFDPVNQTINTVVNPIDKAYAGTFYGNKINIRLINSENGEILKNVTSDKPGEVEDFSNELNNFKYKNGDIIKVEYNDNFIKANILENKNNIGNNTGEPEYFQIKTNGLINVTNKFVKINPLNILGGGKITNTNIIGKVGANEKVTALVNRKIFTNQSNGNGDFDIKINCENGFTSNSVITVSSNGYIPTNVSPKVNPEIGLGNSYINFYRNSINWQTSSIFSSIGFNVENNTFYVNDYGSGFVNGPSNNFNIHLYNQSGEELYSKSFENGNQKELYNSMNGRAFEYGDIIGLSFNPSVYKPVILNGNNTLGNVTGKMEYFKITKSGLASVNFGPQAKTTNVEWRNNNLSITSNLAEGNNQKLLNSNKQIVLLDSNNKVIASEAATTTSQNGLYTVKGSLTNYDLEKINGNKKYTIGLEESGQIIPIYIGCNTPSSNKYVLSGTETNQLAINLKEKQYISISNGNDINVYLNSLGEVLNNSNEVNLEGNTSMQNKVLAYEFINRVGVKNLESFCNKNASNAEFLNWILNNSMAMEEFLSGPSPEGPHLPEGQSGATYIQCIQVWSDIWNTYTSSHYGFNMKLAIAVALTNGQSIIAFPEGGSVGSPVERYNIFETLNEEGKLLPIFNMLDVSHLCYVVNTDIANNQIIKMRNIILQNHNGLITGRLLNDIAYTIYYNMNNPHTGVSVFNNNFYGKNPNISTVWYDGGVCGATARMGAAGNQVFGNPAVQTPQPGHNAFIYYNPENNQWQIGNNIYGWRDTYDADMSTWSDALTGNDKVGSYTLLYQAADTGALSKSNLYMYLAESQTGYTEKVQNFKKAIEIDSLNLGAWTKLVNLYKTNPNMKINEYNELVKNIVSTFKDYPMPMYDLLLQLKNIYAEEGTQQDFNNYINEIQSGLSESRQGDVANAMKGQMSSDQLEDGDYENIKNASVLEGYRIDINNVWNQALGTITFNGETQKLQVSKGWSETNPYAHGKDFTIALENAKGEVLKSLEVNFGEWPESALSNTFDNLGFNYGDKLVISYATDNRDTKLNLSKVYNGSEFVNNYKINGKITIYINRGGLSLTQNLDGLKGNTTIDMKTAEGKKIGNSINLSGQINTGILTNNISIPEGYILEKILKNGKVIYKGTIVQDAEYEIAQLKYQKANTNIVLILKRNADKKTTGVLGYLEGKIDWILGNFKGGIDWILGNLLKVF